MLDLQVWYDEYVEDPLSTWPHRYLAQDITQAFVMMDLFFPGLKDAKVLRACLDSDQESDLRGSKVFDPTARAKEISDRRGRSSPVERPKSFYEALEKLEECDPWVDEYPWNWNLVVRPAHDQVVEPVQLHLHGPGRPGVGVEVHPQGF